MTHAPPEAVEPARRGGWREVFLAFLRLGLTAFGGPIAHLAYFRREFVERRHWLDDAAYADLVALAQVLPGPASSQVGFAIGLRRAGAAGGLAAWAGFTLPSAIVMALIAVAAGGSATSWAGGLAHGLKLAAAAVVAQAVLGMARALCTGPVRALLGGAGAVVALCLPGHFGQLAAIGAGALAGAALLRPAAPLGGAPAPPRAGGLVCLAAFAILLAASFPLARLGGDAGLFAAFYRSGSLVFGGGHVVAPLLDAAVVSPGWVDEDVFLQGYGAVQAMPGPLFSFAAYLGESISGPAGAVIATIAIFLPGLLLMAAIMPLWRDLSRSAPLRGGLDGINAAVVGLLGAALYDPIFIGGVKAPADLAVVVASFVALASMKTPPILVVAGCALAGAAMTLG